MMSFLCLTLWIVQQHKGVDYVLLELQVYFSVRNALLEFNYHFSTN